MGLPHDMESPGALARGWSGSARRKAAEAGLLTRNGAKMDKVEVQVISQGDAVCGTTGYMLKRGEDVAAFYLDGWGSTGRIYPMTSSSQIFNGKDVLNFPSLTIDNGDDVSEVTEICFPEFEGWDVHAVSGGKTMAICLTKT